MEEKARVEDRRLLSRLVLVREEARSLLSGGVQDERIEKNKLKNLPEPEVSVPITGWQDVNHIQNMIRSPSNATNCASLISKQKYLTHTCMYAGKFFDKYCWIETWS